MSTARIRSALRQLDQRHDAIETPDASLLQRFAATSDEAAFHAIVVRHGPGVMQLCRRVLGNSHDADDVFQATFLVLARRAGSIRQSNALGSWLYGVAYRLASKTIVAAVRRKDVEQRVLRREADSSSPDDVSWSELRQGIDAELAAMPEELRAPLLLCYFDGMTQDEAARQLGWKPRTLKARMQRGRALLRRRLTRRGITLTAALVGMGLANGDAGAVPVFLTRQVARAARQFAMATSGSSIPAHVTALAEGALRGLALAKIKFVGVAVASVVVVVGMVGAMLHGWHEPGFAIEPDQAPPVVVADRNDEPAHAKPADQLTTARAHTIAYLKSAHKDGSWDHSWQVPGVGDYQGGLTSLALLALLRSGLTNQDDAIGKGLEYLRMVKPKTTYVVSLQTQVFCLGEPVKDHALVERNVAWLLAGRRRDERNRFMGWGYHGPLERADNSNTQFAVAALAAAADAGVKIDAAAWQEIRDYYLRVQRPDGGWCYENEGSNTRLTMTCGGLCGLHLATQRLKQASPEVDSAIAKGMERLGDTFTADFGVFRYYSLFGVGRIGKLSGKKTFVGKKAVPRDWFEEGSTLLLRDQKPNGSWSSPDGIEGNPIIATSLSLLFLNCGP